MALFPLTGQTRKDEPTPEPGLPECPDWLRTEAKEKWVELLPLLDAMGVLFEIDGNALSRYCEIWARWKAASEWIHAHGETYAIKNKAGVVKCFKLWPHSRIANQLGEQLGRIEAQFGMTPSARAGITIDPNRNKKNKGKDVSRFFS